MGKVKRKKPVVPDYAVVDVGSNNVRMDLYGGSDEGRLVCLKIKEKTSFKCKLAEGTSEKHPDIRRENLALAIDAMRAFDAILTKYGIPIKNTKLVMTEALRAVQKTEQGKKDRNALIAAFNATRRRITKRQAASIILTKKEEALACCEAVKLDPHVWHKGRRGSVAVAAIGGGSIQIGVVRPGGQVSHPVSLPYGLHKLITASHEKLKTRKKSKGVITAAGNLIKSVLQDHYHTHRYGTLVLIGGYWRATGEAASARPLPTVLRGNDYILNRLSAMTLWSPLRYKVFTRAKERADSMPIAAAMARRVAQHFGAKKVIFSDKTIRDAIAHHMHLLNTGAARRPPRGLERLFCPSAPLQALRA